jgi:hypothetical protein
MAANPTILAGLQQYVANKIGGTPDIGGGNPPTGGGLGAAGGAIAGGPTPLPPKPVMMNIQDSRTISPTTGQPFKEKGGKTVNADPAILKAIISHAKAKGIDPYTALAIAYQESEFGRKSSDLGQAWAYFPSKGIPETDTTNIEASRLTNALKEKLAYGAQLQKQGKIKEGESYTLQAYNGYGDLRHNLTEVGGKKIPGNYYGVTVNPNTPMLMSQNPLYGKTVMSLRDEVLKKHAGVKQLVDSTPAYAAAATPTQPTVINR